MDKITTLRFHLHIEYEEYLRYYQGVAINVRLRADNGQIIVFPANRLKPFVKHDGIHGYFQIGFDNNSKFVSLERLGG